MQDASGTFLDLGAGDGAVLRSAIDQRLLDRFERLIAVDVSELRVKRLNASSLPRVCGLVGDATGLPLPDSCVDFVFSHQVIEHVASDRQMASEVARVLRTGGTAFVTSVSKRWYGWYFYRCNGRFRLDPTHVREYRDVAALSRLFTEHGLEVASATDRPLGHPLDKIAVRALNRAGLIKTCDMPTVFSSNGFLRGLRGRELRIPGYFYAEVLVTKPGKDW